MSQKILGRAYAPGFGLCLVEANAPSLTTLILRPMNDPNTRLIRRREAINWRKR